MAGSLKDSFETALLQLIFENSNIANIGDSTGYRGYNGNYYDAI